MAATDNPEWVDAKTGFSLNPAAVLQLSTATSTPMKNVRTKPHLRSTEYVEHGPAKPPASPKTHASALACIPPGCPLEPPLTILESLGTWLEPLPCALHQNRSLRMSAAPKHTPLHIPFKKTALLFRTSLPVLPWI